MRAGHRTHATSVQLSGCGDIIEPRGETTTGTYVISDAPSAYGYGFEKFVPGPGYITASLRVLWYPVSAFLAVKVTYNKYSEAPIIWTA